MEEKISNTFCSMPFLRFETETTGIIRPCCENNSNFGSAKVNGIIEAWNSEGWRAIRKQFIAGERPESCSYCWKLEDAGVKSYRHINNEWLGHYMSPLSSSYDFETGELAVPPKILIFKLSNLCNLACRMCEPTSSTTLIPVWDKTMQEITQVGNYPLSRNFQDIDSLKAEMESIADGIVQVSFSGGEPFMDPYVLTVLEAIEDYIPNINFFANTNLTQLNHKVGLKIFEKVKKFNRKIMSVSIDGFPKLNEYIRQGTDQSVIEENVKLLKQTTDVELHCNFTLQLMNVYHLPETFDYIISLINPATLSMSMAGGSLITAQLIKLQGQVNWTVVPVDSADAALDAVKKGTVQAAVLVGGQPLGNVKQLGSDFKLLGFRPQTVDLLKTVYVQDKLSYPKLSNTAVPTIATEALLVTRTYNTPDKLKMLSDFRQCVLTHVPEWQDADGAHPAWAQVDPANRGKWQYYDLPQTSKTKK